MNFFLLDELKILDLSLIANFMHIRLRESNLLASSVCVFLVSPPSLSSFPFFPSLDPSSSELLSANQRAPLPLSYFHIARIITKYEAAVAADGGAERSERRADARLAVRWGGRASGRAVGSEGRDRGGMWLVADGGGEI